MPLTIVEVACKIMIEVVRCIKNSESQRADIRRPFSKLLDRGVVRA